MIARLAAVGILVVLAGCTSAEQAASPSPTPAPMSVEDAVAAFMDVRLAGDAEAARAFLGPDAAEQYGAGLTGDLLDWELVRLDAADANSFEVTVRIQRRDTDLEETLFVGPGANVDGEQRDWIVRGFIREG
jgi:hypothetical protein